jgi:hypothetical protein
MLLWARIVGNLKAVTAGNSSSESASIPPSLRAGDTGGRDVAFVTCMCRMRAFAGISSVLLAFVFLGARGLGACMFASPPFAAVAFRLLLTVSLGSRSDAS